MNHQPFLSPIAQIIGKNCTDRTDRIQSVIQTVGKNCTDRTDRREKGFLIFNNLNHCKINGLYSFYQRSV